MNCYNAHCFHWFNGYLVLFSYDNLLDIYYCFYMIINWIFIIALIWYFIRYLLLFLDDNQYDVIIVFKWWYLPFIYSMINDNSCYLFMVWPMIIFANIYTVLSLDHQRMFISLDDQIIFTLFQQWIPLSFSK